MQGNPALPQHPAQNPPINFQVNLGAQSLCRSLETVTGDMREWIRAQRLGNLPRYLTYKAQFHPKGDLEVFAVEGHITLQTEVAAKNSKTVHKAAQVPDVTEIILSISIDDIYPMFKGYAKINNPTDNPKQCYHAILNNGKKYTIVNLVYPQDIGPKEKSRLTDWLGILVSEQIRFDTLKIFKENFEDAEDYAVDNLFRKLFGLFKRPVYNNWSDTWENKTISIDLGFKQEKTVEIKKLLPKTL